MYSTAPKLPRLAITLVLRLPLDAGFVLLAMCCSSFVTISRSSTGRSYLVPMGREDLKKVATANLLASRHTEHVRHVRVVH